jgi:hypothetical protein
MAVAIERVWRASQGGEEESRSKGRAKSERGMYPVEKPNRCEAASKPGKPTPKKMEGRAKPINRPENRLAAASQPERWVGDGGNERALTSFRGSL